jgi:hypothetical protein
VLSMIDRHAAQGGTARASRLGESLPSVSWRDVGGKSSGSKSRQPFEMPRQLTLVRETNVQRRGGRRRSRPQERPRAFHPQADEVRMRRHTCFGRERPDYLCARYTSRLRELGYADLVFGVRVKVIANYAYRAGRNSRPGPFG